MIKLNDYSRKVYSQSGEDGIIEKVFDTLNIENGWYCEFGAGDGDWIPNTKLLREKGWNGVLIEGELESYKVLSEKYDKDQSLTLINKYVSCEKGERLDDILKKTKIPRDFDLLSIDVDGNDLWIWESLKNYNPKMVVVEYNYTYPSDSSVTIKYDPSHRFRENNYYGASAGAFDKLAKSKEYVLVACTHGLNLFYCRKDLSIKFIPLGLKEVYHGKGWPDSGIDMQNY
jgi:hypothetical protein